MKGEAVQSPVSGLCTSHACGATHSSEASCGAGSLCGEVQTVAEESDRQLVIRVTDSLDGFESD